MKSLYLACWLITRLVFLTFYYPMLAVGTANVWLKQKWIEA